MIAEFQQAAWEEAIGKGGKFVEAVLNRGARHDPSEVDRNSMDAHAVVAGASWVLGELVRYAQKGSLNPDDVKVLVDAITEKKYPVVEDVDGRTYFHTGKSARDVARASRDIVVAAHQQLRCPPNRGNDPSARRPEPRGRRPRIA